MATGGEMEKIVIRSWPKMVFLWPTALASLLAALGMTFAEPWKTVIGGIFLTVLALNLVVLTFDFPRSTSLTAFISVVAVVLLVILLNQQFSIIAPVKKWIESLHVAATRDFYWGMFAMLFLLFMGMIFVTRFDYWVLTSNELIRHSGLLGDNERYSTAGLKLNTEINDVFEYMLAGSGRIVMNIPGNSRPVVLDNVLRINWLTQQSTEMLSHRVVEVKDSRDGSDGQSSAEGDYE
jgi:hypothetical protein